MQTEKVFSGFRRWCLFKIMRESIDRFGEKKVSKNFFVAVVTTKFFVTKISHALLHVKSTEIF